MVDKEKPSFLIVVGPMAVVIVMFFFIIFVGAAVVDTIEEGFEDESVDSTLEVITVLAIATAVVLPSAAILAIKRMNVVKDEGPSEDVTYIDTESNKIEIGDTPDGMSYVPIHPSRKGGIK